MAHSLVLFWIRKPYDSNEHLSASNRRAQLFADTETKAKAIPQPPFPRDVCKVYYGRETCTHCHCLTKS